MSRLRDLPRTVWIIAAGRFGTTVGSFAYLYLFLYLVGPRDLPATTAGLISGVAGLAVIAGNFAGGAFADRLGHRRTMLLAATLAGLTNLAVPWLPVAVMAVALPIAGYATGTGSVAHSSFLAEAVTPEQTRAAVSVSRAAMNAGAVIGPPLGALLAAQSYTLMFVVEGLMLLAVRFAVAPFLPKNAGTGAHGERPARPWRHLLTDRRTLVFLVAVLLTDLAYRQLYSTVPLYLTESGHPVGFYATLVAGSAAIIVCLEIPSALALRRFPALPIVALGYGLLGAGMLVLGFGAATGLVIVAMLFITGAEILYKSTATAHAIDLAPPGMAGRYQGLYYGTSTSGTILGPPIGAALYVVSPTLLWSLSAAVAGVAAGLALFSGRRRKAPGETPNSRLNVLAKANSEE